MEKVSAIIPVLNEEKHIEELVNALGEQDYPREDIEFLFVDGGSIDHSRELISTYCERKGLVFLLLDNPNKTAPYAFNLGIEKARGDIIVILSAHASYPKDYVSKCVSHLLESDADNVGGHLKTVGKGFVGQCIAAVLSSWFGVGGSDFRLSRDTKYVDTVPFGTFRKTLAKEIGGFNTLLPRNEDNEFNYKIRKNGGKILMLSDVEITYYCRETLVELIKMGYANGKGVGFTSIRYPDVLKVKYFVPLLFTLSLLVLGGLSFTTFFLFKWAFFLETALYCLCDLYFTAKTKILFWKKIIVFLAFPLFHISYGVGTMIGILVGVFKR